MRVSNSAGERLLPFGTDEEVRAEFRRGLERFLDGVDAGVLNDGRTPLTFNGRPAQNEIFKAFKGRRRVVVVAHRRMGKTTALCWLLFQEAWLKSSIGRHGADKPLYYFFAPTEQQAIELAHDAFAFFAKRFPGVQYSKAKGELSIGHNGARIKIGGTLQSYRKRGFGLDGAVIDEMAFVDPEVWTKVIWPALIDHDGFAVFSSTPNGHNHFYELFEAAKRDPEWGCVLLPNSLTGILSEREMRVMREATPLTYRQEIECDFNAPIPGSFYGDLMRAARDAGRVTEVPYDPSLRVITAWDLGISDDTAIWFLQVPRSRARVNVIDFVSGSGKSSLQWAREISEKGYHFALHLLPHDAEERHRATGDTIVDCLRRDSPLGGAGQRIMVMPRSRLPDGIDRVRRLLPICYFDAGRCSQGLANLELYCREKNKTNSGFQANPKRDENTHGADAFRTAADFLRSHLEDAYYPAGALDAAAEIEEELALMGLGGDGRDEPDSPILESLTMGWV